MEKKFRILKTDVLMYGLYVLQIRKRFLFIPYWKNVLEKTPLESWHEFMERCQKHTKQESVEMVTKYIIPA